jgi:hypothetical protein
MLCIPLALQNCNHRPRPLTRRLRPILHFVHWAQVALRETWTKIEELPPQRFVLVRLTRRKHVQSGFGNTIRHGLHLRIWTREVKANRDGAGATSDIYDTDSLLGFGK